MVSKLEAFCNFLHSFRKIEFTRLTVSIYMVPMVFALIIFVVLFLLAAEQPGAVVSNSLICSSIGKEVLDEGGSAVDAAIATLFCEGIALPNGAGIGGGFTAVLYANGHLDSIVATPTAPAAMSDESLFLSGRAESALAAGVPGELKGYWEMHKKYGILSWRRLIEPTIRLCEDGVPITEWFAGILRYCNARISTSPTMGSIFTIQNTEQVSQEYKIKYMALANTLKIIAQDGVSAFYNGTLGDDFVNDLRMGFSHITKKDLEDYKVIWDSHPPSVQVKGTFKIATTPFPTSGPITTLVLNIVKSFDHESNLPLFWHKTIEAIKHGFGQYFKLCHHSYHATNKTNFRKEYEEMINPDFANKIRGLIRDDMVFNATEYYGSKLTVLYGNGSANVCVSSPRGDVVAVTSSLLAEFGAMYVSPTTGIIVNNLLGQFIKEEKEKPDLIEVHRPKPGQHIYTVYSPAIVLRRHIAQPFFIVTGAGGLKVTTLILTALIKYILLGESAGEAVSTTYLHNQLYPNRVEYEEAFSPDIMNYLRSVGHVVVRKDETFENFTAVTCIGHRNNRPDAQFSIHVGGNRAYVNAKSDLNILLVIMIGTLAITVIGLMLYEVLNPTEFFHQIETEDRQTEA